MMYEMNFPEDDQTLVVDITMSIAGSKSVSVKDRFYHAQPISQFNSNNMLLLPNQTGELSLQNSSFCFIVAKIKCLDVTFFNIAGEQFTFRNTAYVFLQNSDLLKVHIKNISDVRQLISVIY